MKNVKQNLQAVDKELKTLTKKLENLIKSIDKITNPKPKVVKVKPVKKIASKKRVKLTDTDKLLNIIKKSKKGIDSAELKKKTGFNDKKVQNMIYRAFKLGKIERVAKGIYKAV